MLETSCHQKRFQLESQRLSVWTRQSSGNHFPTPIKPRRWLPLHCCRSSYGIHFYCLDVGLLATSITALCVTIGWVWNETMTALFCEAVHGLYGDGILCSLWDQRKKNHNSGLRLETPNQLPPNTNTQTKPVNCPNEWRFSAAFKPNFVRFGQVRPWIQM